MPSSSVLRRIAITTMGMVFFSLFPATMKGSGRRRRIATQAAVSDRIMKPRTRAEGTGHENRGGDATMTNASSKPPASPQDKLTVTLREDDDAEQVTAKMLTGPYVTNAFAIVRFSKGTVGDLRIDNVVTALVESAKAVKANNLAEIEELLTSQAIVLNSMFGELSRRSANNMGEYIDASQRYMSMALKAQNQCRMTLETLCAIKNPPVVYARQANIAHGPQQVNNGPATDSHAAKSGNQPNKLLETPNAEPLDLGTPETAGNDDKAMATLAQIDRAKDA